MPSLGLSLERQPPGRLEGQCLDHQLQVTCDELGDMAFIKSLILAWRSTKDLKNQGVGILIWG